MDHEMTDVFNVLNAQRAQLTQKRGELKARRAELATAHDELLARRQAAEEKRVVTALLPVGGENRPESAVSTETEAPETLKEALETVEREEEDLAQEVQALEETHQREVQVAVSQVAQREREALEALRGVLGKEGKSFKRTFLKAIWPRLQAVHEARSARADLEVQVTGEARLVRRQVATLRGYVEEPLRTPASPEEILGYLLLRITNWSRSPGSPLDDEWRKTKAGCLEGASALYQSVLVQEDVHWLKEGRLRL